MKQKKSKLWIYILCAVILSGIIFVATKEISPKTNHIEKTIALQNDL